jgi:iron complex transport system substrate-binding protein
MRAARRAAAAAVLALGLAACGSDGSTGDPTGDEGQQARGAQGATDGFPLTLTNCGEEVAIDAPPQRVVLLKPASVPYLHELGVLDRVVARAGAYPEEYYDEETQAELDAIPLLTDELDAAGHLQISPEVVLAQRPDLVLGEADNLDRATLGGSGIPLLEEPALCPDVTEPASFEDISEQLETYGQVFGVPEAGAEAAERVEQRLEEIRVDEPEQRRTAAVLYPTVGGGTTYAYGTASMAHPQLEAAGFENVFGDVEERVFEVTREELIGRNPDVLVLLHADGDPGPVEEAVTGMEGADALTAVRDDAIVVQLFNFTEPPSPLALDGLQRIVEELSS